MNSPIVLNAKILYENYLPSIPVQSYFHTSWHWVTFGLAPCPIDNYIYCTYGIVMVASMIVLIGIMMFAILRQVNLIKRHKGMTTAMR
jgi:hypothetical protein